MIWPFNRKPEPVSVLAEQLEVAIKAGRRCAYDLRHAAENIEDREMRRLFLERQGVWLTIFAPTDGVKDYTNRLHREIQRAELTIDRLKDLCKKHGIDEAEYIDYWD